MNRFGDIDCSFKKLPPVYGFHSENLVSLEEALQSIESQIKELARYIKIAKKHCNFPNEHGLSNDQSASIYIYTMEWGETTLYRVLNQALRSENRQSLKIWFPYLKLFDSALDLLPIVKEVVWRGVPLDVGKNFIKNQMFTWWPISSCSSSVDVIEQFLENKSNSTLFLIEVVNGKKISGYTEYEQEDEIILKIGTEFRVKANPLKRPDGTHIVHLIEIDDKDEDKKQPLETNMKSLDVNPKASNKKLSNRASLHHFQLKSNLKWKQNAKTIAGGTGQGHKSNELNWPQGIYADYQQSSIYIADCDNHRIVRWKLDQNNGQIIGGGNENRIDQLSFPHDVIVDKSNKYLIICDYGNRRVVRWPLENQQDKDKQIIIENIQCWGLMMNENGDLFVSDSEKHEVKRWRKGEKEGTIVAGGNGQGDKLNQLNFPTFIFVDRQDTVYVSDHGNNRVMKWMDGSKEGIVVAGGQGKGNSLKQLSSPMGLIVNEVGDVYIADSGNARIICWSLGSKEGRVIVGGNSFGEESNQFNRLRGLSFDGENNLYVADFGNHRIQRFEVDKN